MTDDTRTNGSDKTEPYEPPKVEDLEAGEGTSVTAAGGTVTPGAE